MPYWSPGFHKYTNNTNQIKIHTTSADDTNRVPSSLFSPTNVIEVWQVVISVATGRGCIQHLHRASGVLCLAYPAGSPGLGAYGDDHAVCGGHYILGSTSYIALLITQHNSALHLIAYGFITQVISLKWCRPCFILYTVLVERCAWFSYIPVFSQSMFSCLVDQYLIIT